MKRYISIVRTVTPTRLGMGRAAGRIDLPIIREASTGWPVVPGSSLKGVLRAEAEEKGATEEDVKRRFGSQDSAGTLVLTDHFASLLPVRSYYGVFALITCPLAISRVNELLSLTGGRSLESVEPVSVMGNSPLTENGKVLFEDMEFEAAAGAQELGNNITELLGIGLDNRLCVVSDEAFTLLAERSTEVRARTAIEWARKRAKDKTLRTEEYLCRETYLIGLAVWDEEVIRRREIQLGAEASIGAGLVQWWLK